MVHPSLIDIKCNWCSCDIIPHSAQKLWKENCKSVLKMYRHRQFLHQCCSVLMSVSCNVTDDSLKFSFKVFIISFQLVQMLFKRDTQPYVNIITWYVTQFHLKADVLPVRTVTWTVHPCACQTLIHSLQHAHVHWFWHVQLACNNHSHCIPSGFKTWSLSLGEGKQFDGQSGEWRKLHNRIFIICSIYLIQLALNQKSWGAEDI